MRSDEALFNWLQIKVVVIARPQDAAAAETLAFFEQILLEDFHICNTSCEQANEMYTVQYEQDGTIYNKQFRQQLVDQLLTDIEANPKYNEV